MLLSLHSQSGSSFPLAIRRLGSSPMRTPFRSLLTSLALLFTAHLSCAHSEGLSLSGPERDKTEIVLIAAHHSVLFLHPGYTPAILRALLTKISPAAVCIEALPEDVFEWRKNDSLIPTWPQELYATMTWAKKREILVWGADWREPQKQEQSQSSKEKQSSVTTVGERLQKFKKFYRDLIIWEAEQAFGESKEDIESTHNLEALAKVESVITDAISPEERASYNLRDDRITQNILNVASKCPGMRIAVVFGAYHYLPQVRRLQKQPHIRVIATTEFFPLRNQEVGAEWHDGDTVLLLGVNLDSWQILGAPQSRNHQRSKSLLNKLSETYGPESPISQYYQAKWRLLFGDLAKAKEILEGVVRKGTQTTLPYYPDRRWSWPPFPDIELKAKFYLATIFDLENRHEEAVALYRQLLELKPQSKLTPQAWGGSYIDLRKYIESLIGDAYQGGLWEAFQADEALIPSPRVSR